MMDNHKISQQSIALSYQHAKHVEEQGKRIEHVGASLRGNERFSQQEIEFIRQAAQQIQECARAMFENTKLAELDEEHSTEAFTAAVEQHAEAIKLHTEVNKILLKLDSTGLQA